MAADTTLAKTYEPAAVEAKWYPWWERQGLFHSAPDEPGEAYTIVIPPPNVTGVLHLGHVLNNSLQDILVRFEKLRGKNVCWVPGTDHAGIATQSKVEAMLREQGVSRYDLGRERFLEKVWEWREQYGGTIVNQLRRLGCACDWQRERFTLDEELSAAVMEVFVRLYEKGLIYKGTRMINWCPVSRTALSDEEVIYQEVQGHLWHIAYPLAEGEGQLVVATTRPETMLGDTAVAVHPEDERYQHLIGQELRLPLTNRRLRIIADDWVDREFGSGAVKVTPAHDPNDYALAERHGLEFVTVIGEDGCMTEAAGSEFAGLDRFEAREAVVEQLQELGLLERTEDYSHKVGYSERGHVPVEPRLSAQWFCKMDAMAERAMQAVADGRIQFYPERWVNLYNHWLGNIRDWCLSRQLWWGHRIPAWYGPDEQVFVARTEAEAQAAARNHYGRDVELRQDPDVLDTWFSSWLWPFSVFGWPRETADLARYYPTSTLVSGWDIIFFWVARMVMAGLEFQDEVPFRHVYFTSLIRDELGRKLSKSLGNSPDPIETMDEYGTDALRYTMIYIAPMGNDIRYSTDKCQIGRSFVTKVWNAARFRQLQGPLSPDWATLDGLSADTLRPDDRWLLARCDQAAAEATACLERFDFHNYAIQLYEFVWNEFCDWYVESAKAAFRGDDAARRAAVLRVYDHAFSVILRLMHPVMPFVTEELYHRLGYVGEEASIMRAVWPAPLAGTDRERLGLAPDFVELVAEKFDLVRAGRKLRRDYNLQDNRKLPYFIRPTDEAFAAMLQADPESLALMLNAEPLTVDPGYTPSGPAPSGVGKHGVIYLPLEGIIDIAEERGRLEKQRTEFHKLVKSVEGKLGNEKFVSRAPAEVVAKERERLAEYQGRLAQVEELLTALGA